MTRGTSRPAPLRRLVATCTILGALTVSASASAGPEHPVDTPVDPVTPPPPALSEALRGIDLEQRTGPPATTDEIVEIVGALDADRTAELVVAAGGEVIDTSPSGVVLARVGLDEARSFDHSGEFAVREPMVLDVRPERRSATVAPTTAGRHVDQTGAAAWHAAGFTGAGVRIGVVDFFNVPAYWDVSVMGPAPLAGTTARCFDRGADCTEQFFAPAASDGDDHGPAVVEIIRDMAPGATIYVGRATTETDYYRLVDWFAANGVRIINRSLGSRYDGPGDGRGALTGVADYAASKGIVWVNSGGNNAAGRYYRHPVRLVGDLVAFGPVGTDTWLPFTGCIAPGGVRWANDWDLPPEQRTDYDAFIHEAPIGNPAAGRLIASSTARQTAGAPPIETFLGTRCPRAGQAFYLQVRRVSGNPAGDVLEVLDYGDGIAVHTQAPYSATTPVVDSRNAGVVAVGAIDPPGGGRIAAYSSQGPTNDGRAKPDLSAPVGFDNTTITGQFSGTSAAAPVVAGAAALVVQAGLATGSAALGDLLRHSVVDRGPTGRDNLYGTGEFRLPAPPPTPVAAAPVTARPSRYVALPAPTRVLDTRPDQAIGPAHLIGDRWPGKIVDLPLTGVAGPEPGDVTAIAANVTVVGSERRGYAQVLPTRRATLGAFSNLNLDEVAQVRPNFVIAPVGADGSISIYAPAGGHLVVDVLGVFRDAADATVTGPGPSVTGGRFVGLSTPQRALDTRRDGRPVRTGEQIDVGLPAGVDPGHVAALVVTVTGTETVGRGFVQALPGGRTSEIGRTSTLNLRPGDTAANTVIVPVTARGATLAVQLGAGGSAHLIADVTGYITSTSAPAASSGLFVPVRPGRALDTRPRGPALTAGTTVDVDARRAPGSALPASVGGVVWNLTATSTVRRGHLRAWPVGGTEPSTSALNWVGPERTTANGAIIRPDAAGRLRLRVSAGPGVTGTPLAHVVVDVFGYFS